MFMHLIALQPTRNILLAKQTASNPIKLGISVYKSAPTFHTYPKSIKIDDQL